MQRKDFNLKIWLDDERPAPFGWLHVLTVSDAITMLGTGRVSDLSLDHDLGLSSGTGYDVLVWLEEKVATSAFELPNLFVHSRNPVGRKRMSAAIEKIYEIARKRKHAES
ncbi:MAG: hypothetical protein UY96_C0013G0020 [Parcubacteria group bacterium GW2011_GWB1_56_8]|nr:MAG: hypothetical protein UY96_C0013G0020 [Parcubacteria group bacterium GW2011_GWB1_56_8]